MTGRVDDPVYLTEPVYVSREWTLNTNQANRASTPCTVAFEGVPSGKVCPTISRARIRTWRR
jgi:hypothetical protein